MIQRFELKIFDGKSIDGSPSYSANGTGEDWKNYIELKLQGFDGMILVNLYNVWREIIDNKASSYQGVVEGRETIVKYSDTMQLNTKHMVVLDADWE